ncbi:MAG: TetR/AcrR family transcriptional regulator [Gammaproteobacteria bacterium]|nr:TetR/AcrR family transcriptional regulator [Gammaproteobacteria bacterium]
MTKRLKATERKASILAVAKVLFADKGYHGVSVDDIANRLGVSPAVLYRHFSSKEALYEAVLREMSEKREDYVRAALAEPSDFQSILTRMTEVFVEAISRDPDYLRMELMSALEGTPAANSFFENRWRSFVDYIEFSLAELVEAGRVGDVDPRMASLLFQGMLREALYSKCILKDKRYRDFTLINLVRQLIPLFMAAIGYKR